MPRPAADLFPGGVLIVGSGLMGTSLGLALSAAAVPVHLYDTNTEHARIAHRRGAGSLEPPERDPALVVVAVPPSYVPKVVLRLQQQYSTSVFTDVSSAAVLIRASAAGLGCDLRRFVSGHPMAGRETSGPAGADAAMFREQPWVLLDDGECDPAAMDVVRQMVALTGAQPAVRTAVDHDRAMALVSHSPQLVASALAARLAQAQEADLALAGTGVRDTTRIAASSPALWTDILTANAGQVAEVLDDVLRDLTSARAAIGVLADESAAEATRQRAEQALAALLEDGNVGRARL